jgi:hypothetical protein
MLAGLVVAPPLVLLAPSEQCRLVVFLMAAAVMTVVVYWPWISGPFRRRHS